MRAFLYLRVSTEKQEEEGTSLDVQREAGLAYCANMNYEVVGIFVETHTGFEYHERPELTTMRERLRNGEADVAVPYNVDRFVRNQTHIAILMDEAERCGFGYEFATEKFENTPIGKLVLNVRAFAAEFEREKIRERTQNGLRKRVEGGRMLAGFKAPYGYRWVEEDGRKVGYEIIEHEAQIVRRIFDSVASGVSCRQVAMALKNEGVPSAGGGMWIGTNLSKVLRNPIYKGDPAAYRWSGYAAATKARKRGMKASWTQQEGTTIKGGAPAIVGEAVWKTANAIADTNRQRSVRSAKNPDEALLRGGIAVCGYCGFALRHQSARTKWDKRYEKHRYAPREYSCSPQSRHRYDCPGAYIYGEVLDEAAWNHVLKLLSTPELILERLERRKSEDPTIVDLEPVQRQLKNNERMLANIRSSLPTLDDEDFRASMIQQANNLTTQRKRLLAEQEIILQRRTQWQTHQDEITSLASMLDKMRGALREDLTNSQKRRFLELLGARVRVFRKTHEPRALIELSFQPEGAEAVELVLGRNHDTGSLTVDTTACGLIHNKGTGMLHFSFPLPLHNLHRVA